MMINVQDFIRLALEEDIGEGDHTSMACIPANTGGKARLLVKEPGVIAGVELAVEIFRQVDESARVEIRIHDGTVVQPGDIIFEVSAPVQSILIAERLALNFMQRMSGIATNTRKYVDLLKPWHTKVLDTRKTTPLLRYYEKWAVRIGGGTNHRMGLYDQILIKDNHTDYAGGIGNALMNVKAYQEKNGLNLAVEIETRNLDEVNEVLATGYGDIIMLDNFTPALLKEAIALIDGRYTTEASGGITLETLESYAATGVDYISAGALTHSVKSLDLSLKAF